MYRKMHKIYWQK